MHISDMQDAIARLSPTSGKENDMPNKLDAVETLAKMVHYGEESEKNLTSAIRAAIREEREPRHKYLQDQISHLREIVTELQSDIESLEKGLTPLMNQMSQWERFQAANKTRLPVEDNPNDHTEDCSCLD